MTDRPERAKFQDDLQAALRNWWHMDARHGMTATEMILSLLGALDRHGFRINRQSAALSAEGGALTDWETIASEAYQVIAGLADYCGLHDAPEVQRALDRVSGNPIEGELLPWSTPIPQAPGEEGLRDALIHAFSEYLHVGDQIIHPPTMAARLADIAMRRLSPSADLVAAAKVSRTVSIDASGCFLANYRQIQAVTKAKKIRSAGGE